MESLEQEGRAVGNAFKAAQGKEENLTQRRREAEARPACAPDRTRKPQEAAL